MPGKRSIDRPDSPLRCLVVDADTDERKTLRSYLEAYGMAVRESVSATSARIEAIDFPCDVVVMEMELPDDDGFELLRWMRENTSLDVVVRSSRSDELSRILGLEYGAADYVGKTCSNRELVARLHAVRGRSGAPRAARIETRQSRVRFSGWTLDVTSRRLWDPRFNDVPLSNAEFRMLWLFLWSKRRVLSRHELKATLFARGTALAERSVDAAVSRLRQKLGSVEGGAAMLETVRGRGYQFVGNVHWPTSREEPGAGRQSPRSAASA